jgi:signal peptidase
MLYSLVAGDRRTGIEIGPLKLFNVLTSSMEPTIKRGSMIVTVKPEESGLKRGDIVTFKFADEDGSGSFVTHRISKAGPGPGVYTTRGDANKVDDPPITFDDIVGKHVLTVPLLGILVSSMASPLSAVWLISICMLFFLLVWMLKKIFLEEKAKEGLR